MQLSFTKLILFPGFNGIIYISKDMTHFYDHSHYPDSPHSLHCTTLTFYTHHYYRFNTLITTFNRRIPISCGPSIFESLYIINHCCRPQSVINRIYIFGQNQFSAKKVYVTVSYEAYFISRFSCDHLHIA